MAERIDSPGRADLLAAAGIFLLALSLRLLYIRDIAASGIGDFLRLDPLYYQDWAVRISKGEWLGRQPFEMSPLYSYAMGALYRLTGVSLTLVKTLQAILGALTCSGLVLLGRRLFGRAAGVVAGLLLAVYGPAIYYDGQINKTTLALALSLAFAGALVLSGGKRRGAIALGGACLGLAAMVHENVDVAFPVVLLWLLLPSHGSVRERIARAAIFCAAWGAAILPATVHNYLATREVVLITTGGGENFYTGNHEGASGRYGPPAFVRPDPVYEHDDFRMEAARRLGHPVTRSESSRYWWREGMRYVVGQPAAYLRLLWDKFSVFWNAYERPDNFSYENFRKFSPLLALPLPGFGLVAPLAFLGIALSAARWRELLPLHAGLVAYFLSAMIFFTQSRYRMPAVPFLVLFAALGAVRLVEWTAARRARPVAAALALLAGAFLFVNQDPGNTPAFAAQNEAILGELYLNAGRIEEARASFQKGVDGLAPLAVEGHPLFERMAASAELGLGVAEKSLGHATAAETALRAATASPDGEVRADAALELSDLLEARGDQEGLSAALGIVTAARPGDVRSRLRRAESLYKLGRMEESLLEVRGVIALSPPPGPLDLADAHYGAAMIERAAGNADGAREDLRMTLQLNPNHPRAAWIRSVLVGGNPG